MAKKNDEGGEIRTDEKIADLGSPNPATMARLAEDLPEKDKVQKAYKAAMTTDSPQEQVKQKVIIVEESPNASETPSGHALKEVAGIANDTERGEEYTRIKTAKRWGYTPAE